MSDGDWSMISSLSLFLDYSPLDCEDLVCTRDITFWL